MARSLNELEKQSKSHWPCGFRLFYVKDMELLDGHICDAVRVDFLALPPTDHPGPLTENNGDTLACYSRMLNDWFYKGLTRVEFEFKPNVWTVDHMQDKKSLANALERYIDRILGSFYPSHEHKFAYLIYVVDTCCTNVSWNRFDADFIKN